MTDLVFTIRKICIKSYSVNYKTHIVVMKVVSQHLDEHKNNGLIFKLQEILSGQI